jgi:hypothetical protein
MPKRTYHRKNKRGGNVNFNLPYSASSKFAGGAGNVQPYSSASTYGSYVNGSGDSQYDRVFSLTGPDANNQSNNIVGVQGQGLTDYGTPNATNLSLIQSAGSKRKMRRALRSRSRTRSRRGGYFGQVFNQAIVPFTLLGLQQTFGKNSKKVKGTRRSSGRSRRYRR